MATLRAQFQDASPRTRRMVEWMILALVIVVLVLVFVRQMRVVQGQAELSSIKTTLGALRTALIIDHLRKSAASQDTSVASAQHNPFELLQGYPSNYFGDMTPQQTEVAPSGGWVFDPLCVCVGYLPIWAEWFDSPSGDVMAWYRVTGTAGSLQLAAKEQYRWQGQLID